MTKGLERLTHQYLPHINSDLDKIIYLQKNKESLRKKALQILLKAEETIPGAGMHYSIIKDNNYSYPASYKFEDIVRPLRYSLNYLGYTYEQVPFSRSSIMTSGGHLEGCIKSFFRYPSTKRPLGQLIKHNKLSKIFEKSLLDDMTILTNLAFNPAKHKYSSEDFGEIFKFSDALYVHFLARYFGSIALDKAKILQDIEALHPIYNPGIQVFPGAKLAISYKDG